MSLGQQIKNFRQEQNLSQKQLAQLVQISPSYLCDVEKGRCNCSIRVLKRISIVLNVEIAELLK